MPRNSCVLIFAGLALACVLFSVPVRSDDVADVGRKLVAKYEKAIVTVQISAKTTFSSEGRPPMIEENKTEATGLILDPSGLLVMPLSQTTYEGRYGEMMQDNQEDMNVSSEITDLKVLVNGGKQILYKIVLRDKDLDLAFLRPADKLDKPLPAMDLSKSSKVAMLDQVIVINRLGITGGRTITALAVRIQGIVEKPRNFYLSGGTALGSVAFAMDGNPVGIVVVRVVPSARSAGTSPIIPIIIPASDVMEVAKQAPATAAQ